MKKCEDAVSYTAKARGVEGEMRGKRKSVMSLWGLDEYLGKMQFPFGLRFPEKRQKDYRIVKR
jgi:hypothetical protein